MSYNSFLLHVEYFHEMNKLYGRACADVSAQDVSAQNSKDVSAQNKNETFRHKIKTDVSAQKSVHKAQFSLTISKPIILEASIF